MKNIEIAVLMSTFNGASFLREQLQSLLQQTYSNFTLYVRDDGSSDETLRLIKSFDGLKVRILHDNVGNVGPASSFLRLLSVVEADYYFFCDQDDVWFDNKIERAISRIEESNCGEAVPVLYHTDLTLVDSKLNVIGPSFHGFDNVNPERFIESNSLLIQNCIVGCTSAFNRKLRDIAINDLQGKYDNITMHDWWVALFARYFGVILYDSCPSIYYRQHQSNVSGSAIKSKNLFSRVFELRSYKKVLRMIDKCENQVRFFLSFASVSQLDLPEDVMLQAKRAARGSLLSYFLLYFNGVRFSNRKLMFSVFVCCLLVGRWL